MTSRFLNDPVHGHILFDPIVWQFVDTKHFQRLRDIRQMDAAFYVFPGASHTRFEHSLGVSHLAELMVKSLSKQKELEINERDVQNVTLAGLCHDLGHGPFSHLFDNSFIRKARPGIVWSHEVASEQLIEDLIDIYSIDIERDDVRTIQSLIRGKAPEDTVGDPKGFLFDIVANYRNSFDVDKFDYVNRDSHYVGVPNRFDAKRQINLARVIDNQICYPAKDSYSVYELYHMRYTLYKKAYTHRTAQAIKLMIVDALLAADNYLKISASIECPETYLGFTDSILYTIENSTAMELTEARTIISRIRHRHLYKLVEEFAFTDQDHVSLDAINVELQIILAGSKYKLQFDDILFDAVGMNFAMQTRNPMHHIKFYAKENLNVCFPLCDKAIASCLPATFHEKQLRFFCRNPDLVCEAQEVIAEIKNRLFPDAISICMKYRSPFCK